MNTNEHEYEISSLDVLVGRGGWAAYEVSNVLGAGLLEKAYERALIRELNEGEDRKAAQAMAALRRLGSDPDGVSGLYLVDEGAGCAETKVTALTTTDFDGDLNSIPVRTVWCETNCEGFRVRSLKFVTTDVAVVDGETMIGPVSMSKWLMTLKRDGAGWRISSIAP